MARTVLVIDDEDNMRWVLERALKKAGYDVLTASRGEEGLKQFALNPVDLVLLDLKMPGIDGLAVLREIRQRSQTTPVLLLTAYATVPTAVEAMQVRATDYLRNPFELEAVLAKVNERLAQKADHQWRDRYRQPRIASPPFADFVGTSPALEHPLAQARAATEALYPVLVRGEWGSGRRYLASLIHRCTPQTAQARLITLDCSALSPALLGRELPPTEQGRWQQALGGSLLLANTEQLPADLLVDLLPALQLYLRSHEHPHGLRLLLTASGDLPEQWMPLLEQTLVLGLPPLRDRLEDLPLLLSHFAPGSEWNGEATALLKVYSWPGNVAEFQRVVSQAVRTAGTDPVQPRHLPSHLCSRSPVSGPFLLPPEGVDLEEVERGLIQQALELAGGNKTQAARLLNLTRATLLYRLDKYGLSD